VALVQVGHLAGEELDVGAAQAGPLHVDHHPPRLGRRRRDVPHPGPAGTLDHERAHATSF
jgi:hypothetical protein